MRRTIVVIMTIAILFLAACPVSAVEPRYVNIYDLELTLNINTSGNAEVYIRIDGAAALFQTDVTIYLERKVSSTWSRVGIGTENDVWEFSTTDRVFAKLFNTQLGRTGTYRAVAIFNFNGDTLETVTKTATDMY